MADKPNSVRVLQQQLRQAGECITAGELDAASGHVEAALAVDGSSLAALALRDRITRMRSMPPESGTGVQSSEPPGGNSASATSGRFVPKGVNPQSWMSFEGRVAERRFQSLLRSAQEAMERGDAIAARLAVEEARDLRPGDPTVEELSEALVALPPAALLLEGRSFIQSRTFRAAGILVFGVTVMLALDWVRADPPPSSSSAALTGGASAREPDVLASVSRGRTDAPVVDRLPAPQPDSRATTSPSESPAPPAVPGPAATSAETARTLEATGRDNVPALSNEARPARVSQPRPGETPDDFVIPSRVTVDAVVTSRAAEARRAATGEIPDNYVAPAPVAPVTNRSTVLAPVPAPTVIDASATQRDAAGGGSSGALPLGNVAREPSPTPSLGGRAAAPGTPRDTNNAAAAAAAIPLDDRSRVLTAVDTYARAFERLDARAARAVWPTVDERQLGRAFNELESQSFTFASPCNVEVQGARATASCRGTARYVVKVGNREPRTEPRTWDIRLSRSGEEWFIDSVRVGAR